MPQNDNFVCPWHARVKGVTSHKCWFIPLGQMNMCTVIRD